MASEREPSSSIPDVSGRPQLPTYPCVRESLLLIQTSVSLSLWRWHGAVVYEREGGIQLSPLPHIALLHGMAEAICTHVCTISLSPFSLSLARGPTFLPTTRTHSHLGGKGLKETEITTGWWRYVETASVFLLPFTG